MQAKPMSYPPEPRRQGKSKASTQAPPGGGGRRPGRGAKSRRVDQNEKYSQTALYADALRIAALDVLHLEQQNRLLRNELNRLRKRLRSA